MKTIDVLKPKSIEDIKNKISKFSDYRIKYKNGNKRLQYKKKVKFLMFSWYIWKYVILYEYSINTKQIEKYYVTNDIDKITAKYPIAEDYINETYNKATKKFKEHNSKYQYLKKKLLIDSDEWGSLKYIEFDSSNDIEKLIKDYLKNES